MRVYLFRLSLTERGNPDLFDQGLRFPSRANFLETWLGSDHEFDGHGGNKLKYVICQKDENVFSGVFAKWITENSEADPNDVWTKTEQKHWEKAAFFLNTEPHNQIFGIEYSQKAGRPSSILKNLISSINENSPDFGYKIDAFPITMVKDFLTVVKGHSGPITSISFDLVTPNPNASGETSRALKRLRRRVNADRYKGTAESKEGLNVDDPMIADVSDYASDGRGDIRAKSESKVVYDSRYHISSIEIPEEYRPMGSVIDGLSRFIRGKLKL